MNAQTLSSISEPNVSQRVALPPARPVQPFVEDRETGLLPVGRPQRRFSLKQLALAGLILIAGI